MPVIQSPGAQRKLQQAYRLVGFPPAPTLSPEIYPVTLVDDLSAAGGGGSGGGGGSPPPGATIPPIDDTSPLFAFQYEKDTLQAAVAGQYSTITFANPAGSNVLALIAHVSGTVSAGVNLTMQPLIFTSSVIAWVQADAGFLRDTRLYATGANPLVQQLSQCVAFEASSPAAYTPDPYRPGLKLNDSSNLPESSRNVGYVLRPNSGVTWKASLVNQAVRMNFIWLERQLLPGEADGT